MLEYLLNINLYWCKCVPAIEILHLFLAKYKIYIYLITWYPYHGSGNFRAFRNFFEYCIFLKKFEKIPKSTEIRLNTSLLWAVMLNDVICFSNFAQAYQISNRENIITCHFIIIMCKFMLIILIIIIS